MNVDQLKEAAKLARRIESLKKRIQKLESEQTQAIKDYMLALEKAR